MHRVRVVIRGGHLEHVLRVEDILENTLWSHWSWPRRSGPWRRSLQVLENALFGWVQHYFLINGKMGQVHDLFFSSFYGERQRPRGKFMKTFVFFCFLFLGERLKLRGNFASLCAKVFFCFLKSTCALCLWSLNIPVLGLEKVCPRKVGPRPRIFLRLWPWPRASEL